MIPRFLLLMLMSTPLMMAASFQGADGLQYELEESADSLVITARGEKLSNDLFCVAWGNADHSGSAIVPYGLGMEGSTVFLPFRAGTAFFSGPAGNFLRVWDGTQWSGRTPAPESFVVAREVGKISLTVPRSTLPPDLRLTAWFKDIKENGGWGKLYGALSPADPSQSGDATLRGFVVKNEAMEMVNRNAGEKVRIYQFLPRLFGNTNETRKPNGFLEENGSGKFADLDEKALASLKAMGFTHVWPTGVLQQATSTDYSAAGEPADDPDLLKGLAGSPYAIRDYFDVSPDYAVDPAKRLEEFKDMVARVHAAGMKVIIDFVPNHVARSHSSNIRPEFSFGENDDRTKFFSPRNNFFWLTSDAKPSGKGPPLRLPTVDANGNPTSPTAKFAKTPSDGLFPPEKEHGRVTGNNVVSWEPDAGSWYETVKLNYGYDFTDPSKSTRAYPHAGNPNLPVPGTWEIMDKVIAYWQGLGVDGFRVDMAHMVPPEFWHWMISRARTRNPDAFFVAEAYDTDPAKVPGADPLVVETGGGNVMFDLLNSGFDAVYDDATYDKVKEIYEGGAWANDIDRIMARPFVFDNSLRYAENHDEVRLAAGSQWAGLGMEVGRPVTALLFGLSRGPVMLYHGQEVGEPADGVEGFGGNDARTSIFDYWSMPEFTKWVNDKAYDGGRLSPEQKDLREFYSRLVNLVAEPAFADGVFYSLNPANVENPSYGRAPGEQASGHWLYSFLRKDPQTGQTFLVVVNLHKDKAPGPVTIRMDEGALEILDLDESQSLRLTERLGDGRTLEVPAKDLKTRGLTIGEVAGLTPLYFEVVL